MGAFQLGNWRFAPRPRDAHELAVWETGGVDGCKVQVLQLEASNHQQGSDEMILVCIFTPPYITLAGRSRRQQLTWLVHLLLIVDLVQNRNLDSSWGELQ